MDRPLSFICQCLTANGGSNWSMHIPKVSDGDGIWIPFSQYPPQLCSLFSWNPHKHSLVVPSSPSGIRGELQVGFQNCLYPTRLRIPSPCRHTSCGLFNTNMAMNHGQKSLCFVGLTEQLISGYPSQQNCISN